MHRHFPLALTLLLMAAPACTPVGQAPGPQAEGGQVGSVKRATTTQMKGGVLVPAGLVANNGSGVISNNGSSVVSNGGGNIVSNGGAQLRVLAAGAQQPLAGATVRLVDQNKQPIAGVEPVVTDAEGKFTLKAVPIDKNWIVEVKAPTFTMSSLVRPTLTTRPVAVSLASTVVTEYLRTSLSKREEGLRQVNPVRFVSLTALVEDTLEKSEVAIDLTSAVAASRTFASLAAKDPDIGLDGRTMVNEVRHSVLADVSKRGGTTTVPESALEERTNLDLKGAGERIDAYVKTLTKHIGAPWDAGKGTAVQDWNGLAVQFYYGSNDYEGRMLIVDGPTGPYLIANAFFDYFVSGGGWRKLGAPLDDGLVINEPLTLDGVTLIPPSTVQSYEGGELRWSRETGPRAYPGSLVIPRPQASVALVAGNGQPAYQDGTGTGAAFHFPIGLAIDAAGQLLVADSENSVLRRIDPATGAVTTVVDSAGKPVTFGTVGAVVVDDVSNLLVSDVAASVIWKVTPSGQKVLYAGVENEEGAVEGALGTARFNGPRGLSLDREGNLYVADTGNHRIRKVTPAGVVSTVAGSAEGYENGAAGSAKFKLPEGVTIDRSGYLYVADTGNHRLRQISPAGEVKNLVGTGEAQSTDGTGERTIFNGPPAKLHAPQAIALLPSGDLLVSERDGHCVKRIAMGTQFGATVVGDARTAGSLDGDGAVALLKGPAGLVVDKQGHAYVAERDGHRIRKITFP